MDSIKLLNQLILLHGVILLLDVTPCDKCFKKHCISFVANSADPDEMLRSAAFHQGLHCLPKYPLMGIQTTNG